MLDHNIPNHLTRLIYISNLGNLSVQVGVPPGVGSGYGRFEVLRGGGYGFEKPKQKARL